MNATNKKLSLDKEKVFQAWKWILYFQVVLNWISTEKNYGFKSEARVFHHNFRLFYSCLCCLPLHCLGQLVRGIGFDPPDVKLNCRQEMKVVSKTVLLSCYLISFHFYDSFCTYCAEVRLWTEGEWIHKYTEKIYHFLYQNRFDDFVWKCGFLCSFSKCLFIAFFGFMKWKTADWKILNVNNKESTKNTCQKCMFIVFWTWFRVRFSLFILTTLDRMSNDGHKKCSVFQRFWTACNKHFGPSKHYSKLQKSTVKSVNPLIIFSNGRFLKHKTGSRHKLPNTISYLGQSEKSSLEIQYANYTPRNRV